jgi:hypothetical protein
MMQEPCLPCIQQLQRFVGSAGLMGLGLSAVGPNIAQDEADCRACGGTPVTADAANVRSDDYPQGMAKGGVSGSFRACQFANGETWLMGSSVIKSSKPSTYDVKRDVVSAVTAFTLPVLYHYAAPKKWKRPGKLLGVTAVVVLYFATSFAYGKATEA